VPRTVKQTRRDAKRLFRWCMLQGNVDETRARQVVREVLSTRRRGYVPLLVQFQRLVKLEHDRHLASIESALPLSPDLQSRTRESLRSAYGKGVATQFAQNPDLIGGMRIQVGCDVYDGSVRSRLEMLERSLGVEPIRKHARAS